MIKEIKSRQNDKIKALGKISNKDKLFLVEGFHMLEMALESKLVKEIYAIEKVNAPDDIPQYIVTKEIMEKISSMKSPQGVVALCEKPKASNTISDKVLYLDGVSDPGNLGTILRTALAFSYNTVILSSKCCSVYNEKVVQSSQGSIFKLNIIENGLEKLDELKSQKYQIIATEIKGSIPLEKVVANKKHILVLGNEAHGVSKEVLKLADVRVRIEIKDIESLNVGIAGGISMFHLSK